MSKIEVEYKEKDLISTRDLELAREERDRFKTENKLLRREIK